jgi:dTMP kinase
MEAKSMKRKAFYGKGISGVDTSKLTGTLIVIEGGDGSGRSTQIQLLKEWLERRGHPTVEVGLKRSELVGRELSSAMEGNSLGPVTFSLFYATDFADQLEKVTIPALTAGFVVLADRYIYTPIARDAVRGVPLDWLRSVYGIALKPDIILYLKASPRILAERSFRKAGVLSYWESGMDIQRSGDMYECFCKYQRWVQQHFELLSNEYKFIEIDGEKDPLSVQAAIQSKVSKILKQPRSRIVTKSRSRRPTTRVVKMRSFRKVVGRK